MGAFSQISELLFVMATLVIYMLAGQLCRRFSLELLNPLIITIAAVIVMLQVSGVSYEEYRPAGRMIEFWLKPAIVALGLPLYNELRHIRSQFVPLLLAELTGCVVGIVSVVLIARWLGGSDEVVRSLAPKSVSVPFAIEVSKQIGGVAALTSAFVVVVGITGAALGLRMMTWANVTTPVARSLSIGTAAHVVGTSRISEFGERYGAYATVGLIINGIMTAVLAGPIVALLLD